MENNVSTIQQLNLYFVKYESDFSNFHIFCDYLIAETHDIFNSIVNQITQDQEVNLINKGEFSTKINGKYLIINKEVIEKEYSNFYKAFISFNSIYNNNPKIIEHDFNIEKMFSFLNSVFIFTTQNQTLHNIKRKILLQIKNNQLLCSKYFLNNDLIKSEYFLCTIINNKIRDSCITWHYRFFLVNNFHIYLNPIDLDKENKEKANLSNIFDILSISYSTNISLVKCEVDNLHSINCSSKRNYHLWNYLINLFNSNFILQEDKYLIFVFACYLFSKSFSDYSAFSFIVNFYSKLDLPFSSLEKLITYYNQLEKIFSTNNNNSKSYISKLSSLFYNKKNY